MKTLKRILCMMLSMGTLLCVFASCDTAKEAEDTAAQTTETTEPEQSTDPVDEEEEEEEEKPIALSKDKTYEILFIGNSYTQYNSSVGAEFQRIANSAGYKVNVESVVKGAYTLEQFANSQDTMGAQVNQKLSSKQYDYVFMQEQSHTPVSNPEKFYRGARALASKIRNSGAEPVFYCTWGRKNGNGDIAKFNLVDNETMTWNLAAAYRKMGEELNIPVANVGMVFYDIYTHTHINVYHTDGSHPSPVGTYVAALTMFCEVFGVSANEVTYDFDIRESEFARIKIYVDTAVFNTHKIPEKYCTAYGISY